jgi:hypothetical protein
MAYKRVATEGATTDGRNIAREWLTQVAENYDPARYGARVWLEHQRGLFADGPFPALGDIRAVKAKENDAGKLELYADIDPTDQLKTMNKDRQKVYTSVELDHDFAGTGQTYLVGLAVTDSPASLGTEMLQFSHQQGDNSPLASKKQKPANVFTASVEIGADFETDDPGAPKTAAAASADEDKTSLTDKIKQLFARRDKQASDNETALRGDMEAAMLKVAERQIDLEDQMSGMASSQDFDELKTKFDGLYTLLDKTPDQPRRSLPTGGTGATETDC